MQTIAISDKNTWVELTKAEINVLNELLTSPEKELNGQEKAALERVKRKVRDAAWEINA